MIQGFKYQYKLNSLKFDSFLNQTSESDYFATFTERSSRMTVTRTWPG